MSQYPAKSPIVNQPSTANQTSSSDYDSRNTLQESIISPPGLDYLSTIDQFLLQQNDIFAKNKFNVLNSHGQNIFLAAENSTICGYACCSSHRRYEIKIMDNFGKEVMHLYHPQNCVLCCFPPFLQRIEVFSPPDNLIGTVEQDYSFFNINFSIKDQYTVTVLKIKGPVFANCCCQDIHYRIISADERTQIGTICRKFPGMCKQLCSQVNYFKSNFSMDLDVKTKALLLGACFLIDTMCYDRN
ncbi:hypothetical protein HHI36_023445 [Cryptolaemus montrouzieri]|uniref:Phospholipid scramblase n=1 Tax=Cryptolaemus montrouzieri TaxID=559131 RepID=A0ABD2PHB8_9CUCU